MITPRYSRVDPHRITSFRIATASGVNRRCNQRYVSIKNFKDSNEAYARAVEIEKELLHEARYTKDYNRVYPHVLLSKYGLMSGLGFLPCIKKPSTNRRPVLTLYLNIMPYGKIRKLTSLNVFKLGYKKAIEESIGHYLDRLHTDEFTFDELYVIAMRNAPTIETLQLEMNKLADTSELPRRVIPA